MTKNFIYLTGCLFMFASCTSNSNNTQQLQAHIIDSTVNVQVTQHSALNAAKNDSILKVMATQKADTMEKELKMGGKKQERKNNNAQQTVPGSVASPTVTPTK